MTRSVDELKAKFAKRVGEERESFAEKDVDRILQKLSEAIGGLQEAGMPVEIFVQPDWADLGFALVKHKHRDIVSTGVKAMGEIKIRDMSFLFAIGNVKKWSKGSEQYTPIKLYMSIDDLRYQGGNEEMRSIEYDIVGSTEDFDKFQDKIIQFAARDIVCNENDPAGVFNRSMQGEVQKRKLPGSDLKIKPLIKKVP